jgi:hypothetical protein
LDQKLYAQRVALHISHARSSCSQGDYVQAGEKIWGAISALANSRFKPEVFSGSDKKARLITLLRAYQMKHAEINVEMQQYGFYNLKDIVNSIYGLHEFFFGGTDYKSAYLAKIIPFLIQLIGNL